MSGVEIAERAAALSREIVAPHADDVDLKARFPAESVTALRETGLLGLCVGNDHGGLGQGQRAFAAVTEHLGRSCASTAMIYVMHTAATQAIAASPTLNGKADVLRDIASGKPSHDPGAIRGRHAISILGADVTARGNG